jgi:hypothetical protein
MTLRKGMADYRQAGAGGILFMGLLQAQGQEMTYEQRRILYRSMYSNEVAKIEMDETIKKNTELFNRISMLIGSTKLLLDQAGRDYLSRYEGHNTHDNAENEYAELLAQILDNLWEVAIKAKMIESVHVEMDAIER